MMRLSNVKYAEFEGTPQEWTLDGLSLSEATLIVGKNASGKSRVLNVIRSLARQLAGIAPPLLSGNYDIQFVSNSKIVSYQLKYEEKQVIEERFSIDGKVLLDRGDGGKGKIWAQDIDGGKYIRFQTPTSEIAAVARRDAIQHDFLERLYSWGSSLRHYYFGTALGKDRFTLFAEKEEEKIDESDPNGVVALYRQAEKEFPEDFNQLLMRDMQQLDYPIEELGVKSPVSIRVRSNLPGELVSRQA